MSPQAVEALARDLAVKFHAEKKAWGDLATEMVQTREADRKYKEEDAAFKAEVRKSLGRLTTMRADIPLIAVGLSVVSMIMATVALIGVARAGSRLTDEISALRAQVSANERREAPGH